MKIIKYYILIFILIFFNANCITKGNLIKKERIIDLDIKNITPKKIVRLFGEKKEDDVIIIDEMKFRIFKYEYSKLNTCLLFLPGQSMEVKFLFFEFRNNIFNGYYYFSNLKEEFNFNEKLIDKIILDKSSSKDIVQLFGKPNGYFHLPTSFITMRNFKKGKKIFLYLNLKYQTLFSLKPKILILAFDENNLVIKKVYKSSKVNILHYVE